MSVTSASDLTDLKERVESGSDGTFVLFPESPSGERRGGEIGLHAPLDVPVPRPGERFVVELAEAPALQYERGDKTEEDVYYAKLARRIGGIRYDPGLGQAARELAHFHASQGVLPPTEALSFLLDSGGAAAWGVEQLILVTSDESEEALLGQLRKGEGETQGR